VAAAPPTDPLAAVAARAGRPDDSRAASRQELSGTPHCRPRPRRGVVGLVAGTGLVRGGILRCRCRGGRESSGVLAVLR